MPRVSVIIPTYNTAHYLPEAVESVLAQTYTDLELIVIDDGSTDNTKEVIEPYLGRIVFLETENNGPSKARNRAIRASSGEYVAFLDADDIWYPDKLDRQMTLFSKNRKYNLLHSDASETGPYSSQEGSTWFSRFNHVKAGLIFSELLSQNFIILSSVIVKRECLEKVGLFDEELKCWEGYDLWLRIAFKHLIGFVNAPLYMRRLRENSTFFSSRLNEITGIITVMEKWNNDTLRLSEADKKAINQQLRSHYLRLGGYYLGRAHPSQARPALKNSIARGFSPRAFTYFMLSMFPPFTLPYFRNVKTYFGNAKRRLNL
jgi:glycosyltransferase involved in cell wall biosynthesis